MRPSPEVLADLRRQYPRISAHDLVACWQNASRHWYGVAPEILANEPSELTAARVLFVHSQFEAVDEDRANYSFCMWMLVNPYTTRSKP